MKSVSEHSFRSDGLSCRYGFRGSDPSQTPVVLLHGGGQTQHSWAETAERLAASGRHVYTLDARGHGDSDWDPNGNYAIEDFVGDLITFLELLDRPAILVGASLGGITALWAAGRRGDLVAGLVLVDVVIALEPEGVARIHSFMTSNVGGFGSLEEAADAIAAYNPDRPRPGSLDALHRVLRRGDDGRWRWHWDPAFMKIDDEPLKHVEPEMLKEVATDVDCPTLVVRGVRSDVVDPEGVSRMRALIPHAQSVEVAAAGHMVPGTTTTFSEERWSGSSRESPDRAPAALVGNAYVDEPGILPVLVSRLANIVEPLSLELPQ